MTTILLVRHGETDWNREGRIQGHTDRPLNDVGRAQARSLAERLAREPIAAVYASDLARALDTARAVADVHGLAVEALPELREKNFGSWEGLTDGDVRERFPHARLGEWGDGETTADVAARVVAAIRDIAEHHPGRRVVVVTHGGPLRAVLRHCAAGADTGTGAIANCHVARIAVENGALRPID